MRKSKIPLGPRVNIRFFAGDLDELQEIYGKEAGGYNVIVRQIVRNHITAYYINLEARRNANIADDERTTQDGQSRLR